MIDHHVSGDKIKDNNVVIETVIKDKNLEKKINSLDNDNKNSNDEIKNETKNEETKKDNNIIYTNEKYTDDKNENKINEASETQSNTKNNSNETTYQIININKASLDELITLPGIGNSIAEKIITYRTNNKFNSIDDIKNVSGIGDAKFNKIKKYIEV